MRRARLQRAPACFSHYPRRAMAPPFAAGGGQRARRLSAAFVATQKTLGALMRCNLLGPFRCWDI